MCEGGNTIWALAPAKINLHLDVLRRRPDGYHDIRSVVAPVSLYDRLRMDVTDGVIETAVDDQHLPFRERVDLGPGDVNLATRAARALQARAGYTGGARIRLEKRIPVAAGLGGGSADAAAVLLGLNELWGTGLPKTDLMEVGATLGADIPALVHGGLVVMEGVGEQVRPALPGWTSPGAGWWVVLFNPGFGVPTKDVYGRFKTRLTVTDALYKNMLASLRDDDSAAAGRSLFNALQDTVFRKYPLLEMLVEAIRRGGACGGLLSGSGATVFALVAGEDDARAVEQQVRGEMGPWLWSKVVRTLPDGVMVAHGPLEARV